MKAFLDLLITGHLKLARVLDIEQQNILTTIYTNGNHI